MIFSARRRIAWRWRTVVRMKKVLLVASASVIAGALVVSADWSSSSGNPQRDGWSRSEDQLSRESAAHGDIRLLYSYRVDAKPQRMGTPVMLTNIISWKGFKSLAFVAGASDVYSIDYSLGRPYFRTHLDSGDKPAAATALCPGGITAGVTMSGGSTSVARNVPAAPAGGARGASGRGGGGGGGNRGGGPGGPHVWAVSADGFLQTLRQQDGDNKATAPIPFVPANSRVSDLTMNNGVIYAATQNECGGNPNALYAVDVTSAEKKVVSFPTNGGGFSGSAGVAASTDGNLVYGLVPSGNGSVAGQYKNTVLALDAKTLALKDYFTPSDPAPPVKKGAEEPGATPAVFVWNGKDVIVSGGSDGRIYLLDFASPGGADHHTPLAKSSVFAAADGTNGIVNAFATWIDPGNTRWIYSSIVGANGNGSIVAFTVEDDGGKPKLTERWRSRDLISPAAPAVTNGLVFALSTGQAKTPKNAVLYGLDSSTGKEIWSSGQTATSYATGGLAINASIVMFATHDSQIHAYGIPIIF